MNEILVGELGQNSSGEISFTYKGDWINSSYARPISLSMPLREQSYKGEKVFNFFDNLLPDNESIRTRIQQRFSAHSTQCIDLLYHIGADCVGALQLLPEHITSKPSSEIDAERISEKKIAMILKNYHSYPLGMIDNNEFRISLAGAQEKTAFLKHAGKWWLPRRTTPTTHIFKLPIGRIEHSGVDLSDSVENEWICLQILSAYSIPVNESKICSFDSVNALVCKRFDRTWDVNRNKILRLPQEDLCQALNYSSARKYEADGGPGILEIMNFLKGSYNSSQDRYTFFKTCLLFWVLGAIDGHAKNFSIQLQAQSRYVMTPVYDVISAYPLIAKHQMSKQKMKMAMSVFGKKKHYQWQYILLRHWQQTSQQVKLSASVFSQIVDDVFDNMEMVISKVEKILPNDFPTNIAESIFSGMRRAKN